MAGALLCLADRECVAHHTGDVTGCVLQSASLSKKPGRAYGSESGREIEIIAAVHGAQGAHALATRQHHQDSTSGRETQCAGIFPLACPVGQTLRTDGLCDLEQETGL